MQPSEYEVAVDLDERKVKLTPLMEYIAQTYLKVGEFFKWSHPDFMNTPWDLIEYYSEEIDRRIAPYNMGPDTGNKKGPMPFNYMHLSILLALAAMFSGGSNPDNEPDW